MDLVFEYVDRYKHHPQSVPGLTWHDFVGLVERTGRSEVRDRLIFADAVMLGQPANDAKELGLRMMEKAKLERLAWPDREHT